MAEINTNQIHISLTNDEMERLVWVLNERVIWLGDEDDYNAQAILHELFDALGVELN